MNWHSSKLIVTSEAIPFLVISIGFQKPYILTQAIMTSLPGAPVHELVAKGVELVGPTLIKDHAKEVLIFVLFMITGE